jgi:hypothetical protein
LIIVLRLVSFKQAHCNGEKKEQQQEDTYYKEP